LRSLLQITEPSAEYVAAQDLGLIGKSVPLMRVLSTIQRLKDVTSTVIIFGESGTGKELVARALHKTSPRGDGVFQAINCGAIPEKLLESELFGHVRGAFTDAKSDRKGIFEICAEGTLLLDEISEMPLPLQVKLLRVLQEREVIPVGSSRSIKVNTRVLASTNRDLDEEVKAGRFREDLFFRLSVLRVELPPLRDRCEDVPLLVEHFLKRFNERFNRSVMRPSDEEMARLMTYDWPGNVRELCNAVERGVVLSEDEKLHFEDILPPLARASSSQASGDGDADSLVMTPDLSLPLGEAKQRMEEAYIRKLLKATHGNISEAARISGLYRANIYRLMARYGIDHSGNKQTT
jgi:DNA-binding NtrC family response regulator